MGQTTGGSPPTQRHTSQKVIIDAVLVVVVAIAATLAIATDAIEGWAERLHAVMGDRVDEVYLGLVAVLVAIAVFAYRRWRDAARESSARAETQTRLHEAAGSNEQLQHFASVASHDLRAPLANVQTALLTLDHVAGDHLEQPGRILLDRAVANADRMLRIIDALLQFATVDRQPLRIEVVDLRSTVEEARQSLPDDVAADDLELLVGDLPDVLGDPAALSVVLQNLLSNALKFRAPGRPAVVEVTGRPSGAMAVITVRDHGVGIPKEQAERVFEMFSRAHGQAHGGSGIGLATCRRIIERHGGDIFVAATCDQGTAIEFTLPLHEVGGNDAGSPSRRHVLADIV